MKVKFPVILKIALIGILATGLASGVLLTITSINRNNENQAALITDIDNTLLSIEQDYEIKDTKEELQNSLGNVTDYINTRRHDIPELDTKSEADFASFKEYKQFIKDSLTWIYPNPDLPPIGSSLSQLAFKSNFRNISLMLNNACLTSGAKYAYIAYYNLESGFNELIFINDSRLDTSDPNDDYYHLPASHVAISVPSLVNGIGTIEIDGKNTRYIEIDDGSEDQVERAYVFVEYDFDAISAGTRAYLLTNSIIIAAIMAGSVLVYMLLAYLFVVRNLNRLTLATNNISNNLKNKGVIEKEQLVLKSHDELGLLASSFDFMQDEIINYTEIIKKETKENEKRAAELDVASKIQLDALPKDKYSDKNVDLKAFIKPAKVVGGDFYDYFYNKEDFIFVIADVSGKGIPASLFMMKSKALIKSKILSGLSLVDAVKEANNELNDNNTELLFVTAFIGLFNPKNKELRFINAGHEKPYIIHDGKVTKLDGNSNYVLGVIDGVDFVEEKVSFEPGDTFFSFTDGLNESINSDNEEFGYQRIEKCLSEVKDTNLENKISKITAELSNFVKNEEQFDDITMLTFRFQNNKLHLSYDKKDYSIIEDATNMFYKNFSYLNENEKSHVGIVLDELLNNLVSYEKRDDLKIDLDFEYHKDELKLAITSNGENFDPFAYSKTANNNPEKIGGHGINIVKNLTKKQSYTYKNKKSVITLLF